MRTLLYVLAVCLLITGCSQKFSYRDAYKFDRHTYPVKIDAQSPGQLTESTPLIASAVDLPLTVEAPATVPVIKMPPGTKSPQPVRLHARSLMKGHGIQSADTTANPTAASGRVPLKSRNWAAITSIILVLSFFLFPLALLIAIPAIIFGIIGLKSERRKLAVAGIILNIISLLVTFFVAASFSV